MKNFIIITRNSKILSLLFFLFAAALVSGQAAAQKITLDGDCEIPLSGPVTIDLLSGDIIATSVSGIPGSCTDGSGGEGGTVPTVSFSVNGGSSTTVTVGTAVNVVWNSSGADNCVATGGWSGSGWNNSSKALSGSQSLATGSAVPNIYSLSLACTNSAGTTTRNRSVTISADTGDVGSCTGSAAPPAGMIRETNMDWSNTSKTTLAWTDLWPQAFPNGGQTRQIRIRPNRYGALSFNSGTSSSGKIDFTPPSGTFQTSVSTGNAVVTFSECPGDFGPQPDARCRSNISGSGAFRWRKTSSSFQCTIANNQALYFNIVYANALNNPDTDPPPTIWRCNGSTTATCGHHITAQGE